METKHETRFPDWVCNYGHARQGRIDWAEFALEFILRVFLLGLVVFITTVLTLYPLTPLAAFLFVLPMVVIIYAMAIDSVYEPVMSWVARRWLRRTWKSATGAEWTGATDQVQAELKKLAQAVANDPEPMKKRFYLAREAANLLDSSVPSNARIRDYI